jgi:hypothetical protein
MQVEFRFGMASLTSPDASSGPLRFARGAGRGGAVVDAGGS